MRPALFDTTIYIAALRNEAHAFFESRQFTAGAPLWLSSVVLEELYAGAGEAERWRIERLQRHFTSFKRTLVPNLQDWVRAGKVLAQVAAKYGFEQIGRGRLTSDALIATSAGRLGIRIITSNDRDFRRLAEFSPFHWQTVVVE